MERAFFPQTFEYDHDLISGETTGVVLHYQDPENFMAFGLEHVTGTTMKPRLMRRKDGEFASLATGSNFTITSGDRVRVAIKDDPGNAALQKLEVYVAGTSRFASTAIDDDWSAGLAGFYVRSGQTSTVTFDNCKIGIDNNADDDCDDAGDDVQIDDDFASNVVNLTYDNNGNMTDDGILKYVYDAWNRLVKAKRRVDAETVIATYSYDGATRRTKKVVANQGIEVVANDGGNTTVKFYYGDEQIGGRGNRRALVQPWSTIETRNGSSQATSHYVWGMQYVDELVAFETNGDTTIGNDTNPDVAATGEASEVPGDTRLVTSTDRTGRIAALTTYDSSGTNNGFIRERVLNGRQLDGDDSVLESGAYKAVSLAGPGTDVQFVGARFVSPRTGAQRVPAPPPTTGGCQTRLRAHEIPDDYDHGFDKHHIGIDIDTNGDGIPDSTLDYGWNGDSSLDLCNQLIRWNEPPDEHFPGVFGGPTDDVGGPIDTPWDSHDSCVCDCLKSSPSKYGCVFCGCTYGLWGVPPLANSNGALHKSIDDCKANCGGRGVMIPSWLNDENFPGWDNKPQNSCH